MPFKTVMPVPMFVHYGLTALLLLICAMFARQITVLSSQLDGLQANVSKETEIAKTWREAYTQVLGELGEQPLTRPSIPRPPDNQ